MLKKIPCPDCNGNGFVSQFTECSVVGKKCSACDGLGYVEVPQTNADRIRAMSDEELVDWLARTFCHDYGKPQFIDWLKQPAEE